MYVGQLLAMWETTSEADMPYFSWTKLSTLTQFTPAALPAARSCGSAPA